LIVDRDKQGRIAVTTDVIDENDDAVVEIVKNHFTVTNDAFKVSRPDLSTLSVVIKHHKQEVLNIRYSNPRMLRINGIFRYSGIEVKGTDSTVELYRNGGRLATFSGGTCVKDAMVDFGFGNQ